VRDLARSQSRASVLRDGGLAISSSAYGSKAEPPAVARLSYFCRLLGIKLPHGLG
jgi:hypothetical protein